VLRDLVRLKSVAAPPDLNAALARASRVPGIGAALLSRRLDAPLFEAAVALLRERDDAEIESVVTRVIASWDAALRDGLDLSQPRFRAWFWERTPLAGDDPYDRQGSPFYRAAWPESAFDFLTGGGRTLELEVVARAASGPLSVRLDRRPVAEIPVGARWGRHTIRLDGARRGANRLTLAWPPLAADESQALDAARARFALGAPGDLFPVFGEVHSLTLRGMP
jgi:hypothetical protein